MTEDDLKGIVDELSDDEDEKLDELGDYFAGQGMQKDREELKEIMRNVKQGYGRQNSRAFSGSRTTRGKYSNDKLFADDGIEEARRLGVASDDEDEDEDGKKKEKADDAESEDEEAAMERAMLERMNGPKRTMYESSSDEDEADLWQKSLPR